MSNLQVSDDIRLAQHVVLEQQRQFEDLGLAYEGTQVEHSQVAGEAGVFLFRNGNNGIAVRFAIFPHASGNRHGLSALLLNKEGQKLNIDDYLEIHRRPNPMREAASSLAESDLASFVRSCVAELLILLAGDLREILDGNRWEAVPFNWHGYR